MVIAIAVPKVAQQHSESTLVAPLTAKSGRQTVLLCQKWRNSTPKAP